MVAVSVSHKKKCSKRVVVIIVVPFDMLYLFNEYLEIYSLLQNCCEKRKLDVNDVQSKKSFVFRTVLVNPPVKLNKDPAAHFYAL